MDNEKEYNEPQEQEDSEGKLDKKESEVVPPAYEPPKPPKHDAYEVEKEWAEKLGMNFDSERASATPPPVEQSSATPPPAESQPAPAPAYVMPPGTQLPPMHSNGPMPPTFMVWAILATICCCLPAGIVAIIFSSQVSTKYYSRDFEGARRASERAEIWIIVSIVLGIIVNALYFPFALMFHP